MDCFFNCGAQHICMKSKRPRILVLLGSLLLLITIIWVSLLFNTTRNFAKLQELIRDNPASPELRYYCAAFRRSGGCQVYTLAVEKDLRFYPNKYIIITKFDNQNLVVDLMSGPGPESTITLNDEMAWQYLVTMKLNLPR